uniref:Uncharacterized protein n=1 Tax=Plectus sambesii TaxID=2011161 RepID=A0A914VVA4_9BILA
MSGFPSPRRWFGNELGQSSVDRQASHILTLPRRGRPTSTTRRSQSFPACLVDAPSRPIHGDAQPTPTIAVWETSGEDLTDARLEETAILLDANILRTEDTQALTVAVLAILIRSSPTTADVQILFDYILEAITVFPRVLPVIHSFVDQRIVSLLHSCHSPSLLQAVLRVVESTVVNKEEGQEEPVAQHQHVSAYLQQRGFGGLWRYAGSFLNDTASRQAVTPDLCACLERLLGSL